MSRVYPRKMFYDGALQHGISVAVAQQKAVLCFVTNDDEESTKWEQEYLQDEAINKLITTKAVALRLEAGSDEAGYLAQIFPLPQTPTVVIMKNGELKEYIIPGVTKEDFKRRLQKAFSTGSPAPSTPQSEASSAQPAQPAQSDNPPTTATSENVRRILAERAARFQAEQEEAARLAEEERERVRAKARADEEAGIQSAERKKAQLAQQYKDKRKQEDEHRKQVLQRIEADRKERRMQAEARQKERSANQSVGDVAASLVNAPSSKLSSTAKQGAFAHIQVRLFDGSTIRSRFQTSSALKDVRKWVDENRTDGKEPFTFKHLLTPLPSRAIDATEEDKVLGDLELSPSSTLVLIPVDKYSSAYAGSSGNVFMDFIRYVLGFFTWIFGLLGLAGSRPAAQAVPQSEESEQSAASQDRTRVRGFQNGDDRRRDQQFYNGNSLSFEPRPDEDEK
jgi:hypothetical protein